MRIKDIKRMALSKLDRKPLSDKFIYFAFLVRCYLTFFVICTLIIRYINRQIVNTQSLTMSFTISIVFMIFDLVITVLYSYSLDKKLIENSNGKFDFDVKELFYYLKTKGALWEVTKVYLAQMFLIFIWMVGLLFMAFLLSFVLGIVMPNTLAAMIFIVIASTICFLVLAIYVVLSYSMASFIKIENPDMKAFDCINESKVLMTGNIMKLFLLVLSFIGWFLVAFFTLGIAYPFVLVYYNAAVVEFYKSIKENSGLYENYNENDELYNNAVEETVAVESDETFAVENKKSNRRSFYLGITIVLSVITFVGMNYINNKEVIDHYRNTGEYGIKVFKGKTNSTGNKMIDEIIENYQITFNFGLY